MKILNLLSAFLSVFLLSGCITVFEKYKINSDGSGTMEYIIDMSEMYEMIASFSDSSQEIETVELDKSLKEALPGLEQIKGISNAELTGDMKHYVAGIKFDFTGMEALNKAIAVLYKGNESETTERVYVERKGKKFTRYGQTSEEFNKETLLGSGEISAETAKMVLESMKYKISVEFARPVKKVTSLAAHTVEGNLVTIETNFSEMLDNPDFLKTFIKTK